MIKDLQTLRNIIAEIEFGTWQFRTEPLGDGYFVQCVFMAPDNEDPLTRSGKELRFAEQRGRKWYISTHMTKDEVIQTVLLAVFKAIEHEVRERFLVRGVAPFHSHIPVDNLIAAARDKSLRVEVA